MATVKNDEEDDGAASPTEYLVPEGDAYRLDVLSDLESKPSLSDSQVVDGLVRQFMKNLSEVRRDYSAESISPDTATSRISELCAEATSIFRGEKEDWTASVWNTRGQIDGHIRDRLKGVGAADDALLALFTTIAMRLISDVMVPHEDGSIDDDIAKFRIDVIIEDAVSLLLGLPDAPQDDAM